MTVETDEGIFQTLQTRLAGVSRIAVVGIGDELTPVDCAGMLAARTIEARKIRDVRVFAAGTVPESVTAPIRRYFPQHILLLDAAEMGAPPGTIAIVDPGMISAGTFSTHAIPLTVFMEYLEKDAGAAVTFLGIQPWTGLHGNGDDASGAERFRKVLDGIIRILSGR